MGWLRSMMDGFNRKVDEPPKNEEYNSPTTDVTIPSSTTNSPITTIKPYAGTTKGWNHKPGSFVPLTNKTAIPGGGSIPVTVGSPIYSTRFLETFGVTLRSGDMAKIRAIESILEKVIEVKTISQSNILIPQTVSRIVSEKMKVKNLVYLMQAMYNADYILGETRNSVFNVKGFKNVIRDSISETEKSEFKDVLGILDLIDHKYCSKFHQASMPSSVRVELIFFNTNTSSKVEICFMEMIA